MVDLTDDERRQVLGEVLTDQLQAILEYVKDIPKMKEDISDIKDQLSSVKNVLDMHELDIVYLRGKLA